MENKKNKILMIFLERKMKCLSLAVFNSFDVILYMFLSHI